MTASAVAVWWSSAGASATIDIRGTYAFDVCPGQASGTCTVNNYPQTSTIEAENFTSGAVTGQGSGGGSTWTLAGTVSGNTVVLTFSYTNISYESTLTATISPDGNSISGTYTVKNSSSTGVATGTRVSGGPGNEEAQKAKEAEERAAGKRPSATLVSCYFDFASSIDTCTAEVADGSSPPGPVPTGTVSFSSASPGAFPSGHTCTLAASPEAPRIPFCAVTFHPPDSNLPTITAIYSGDSQHASSAGHTQFLGSGVHETTAKPSIPPKGHYANEITVETNVPADGTTVETAAETQTGPIKDPPDPASPLGMAINSLGPIDPSVVDPENREILEEQRNALRNVAFSKDPQAAWEKCDSENEELHSYAYNLAHSTDPRERAEGEAMLAQVEKFNETGWTIFEVATGKTSYHSHFDVPLDLIRGDALGLSLERGLGTIARKKHAKPRSPFTLLASTVHRHTAEGRRKVKLHLNRVVLRRLAAKHKRLTVYVWVRMFMPESVSPSRTPVVIVKKLTLHRR